MRLVRLLLLFVLLPLILTAGLTACGGADPAVSAGAGSTPSPTALPAGFPFQAASPTSDILTASPESEGPFTTLFTDGFDNEDTPLFLGRTEYGTHAYVNGGSYTLEVADGGWQNVLLDELTDLSDGVVLTEVALTGDGAAGVVARSTTDASGAFWFYVCWISTAGEAGCHAVAAGQWVELWVASAGDVPVAPAGALNALALTVEGPNLTFVVNGTQAVTLTDVTCVSGRWGVFTESFDGKTTASFASLTIGDVSGR